MSVRGAEVGRFEAAAFVGVDDVADVPAVAEQHGSSAVDAWHMLAAFEACLDDGAHDTADAVPVG